MTYAVNHILYVDRVVQDEQPFYKAHPAHATESAKTKTR